VPVALIAFGFLFQEFGVMTAFNAAAYALPAFLAFTFGTRISFVRNTARFRGRKALAGPLPHSGTAPEADAVIRPDFAHPPAMEHSGMPSVTRRVAGDPVPLPDFLRIAEEPEPPRRKARKGLFPRRG
jgi:hypothetical protein